MRKDLGSGGGRCRCAGFSRSSGGECAVPLAGAHNGRVTIYPVDHTNAPKRRGIFNRSTRLLGAGLLGASTIFALTAAPASAHVTVSADTTEAGAFALLTFSVPHGCEGSATTGVEITLPEDGIGPVTPSVNPNWEVERVRDGDQNVTSVVYTAKSPLADDLRDSFEISTLILPDTEGETVVFPITQGCTDGESAWDEVAGPGEDPHDLEFPAPAFTVTAPEASADAPSVIGSSSPMAWVGVGLGAAAVILSGVALSRTRRD